MIHYEDLEVGTTSKFGHYDVTREEVMEFARKYDPQPFHLDDEAAAQTHFGRLSASGWHTCAMMMAMLVENMKTTRQAGLGSPGMDNLRWVKPVYPGDVLRVEGEVVGARSSASRPQIGFLKLRSTVYNQDDEAVMRQVANVIVARRPA